MPKQSELCILEAQLRLYSYDIVFRLIVPFRTKILKEITMSLIYMHKAYRNDWIIAY